jgi:hypothetical protein
MALILGTLRILSASNLDEQSVPTATTVSPLHSESSASRACGRPERTTGRAAQPDRLPAGTRFLLTDGTRVAADSRSGRPEGTVLDRGANGLRSPEGMICDRREHELLVSGEGTR